MRTALISLVEESATEVRVGGHPIAWHQVQAALALNCERIICLAAMPSTELSQLQHAAELGGATFHAISHHRAMAGLVHTADTLVVFAPGLMADHAWLAQAFGVRAGIAVLPADAAIVQGFERIDRERAWAGVLATRGDAVEALSALPPDADPVAGLLRVALQRGANGIKVPADWLGEGRWALVFSHASAASYQRDWYARHVPSPPHSQPGRFLANRLARELVERFDQPRRAALMLLAGGAIAAPLAALTGYLGHTTWALAALVLASALSATGAAVRRLVDAGSMAPARVWPEVAREAWLDLALIAIAASPAAFEGWTAAYAVAVLLAVARLADRHGAPLPLRPLSDRIAMLSLLALAAAAGFFAPAAAVLSLTALALLLFWPSRRS